jgi:ubiquinone biosynthesis protein UbiJ
MTVKTFDCVEMKRQVQDEIFEETKGMSREEELEYFHAHAAAFWKEVERLRAESTIDRLPQENGDDAS